MLERGEGVVAGVASVAGYRGIARSEGYGATKAGQINLLESLRTEVGSRGVRVTTICPGFVRTEMTEGNRFPMPFIIEADAAGRAICDGLETRPVRDRLPHPDGGADEGRPLRAGAPLVEVRGTRMTSHSPETPPLR